ncbi:hypothetical protein VTL71DRAFT_10434 [Oculimacula yallundae]|uniref:Uncharacterized protein n=1 Tax=Oculimacula yallundae TaxID=86028 RepID=A0ABR4CT34_9HELO
MALSNLPSISGIELALWPTNFIAFIVLDVNIYEKANSQTSIRSPSIYISDSTTSSYDLPYSSMPRKAKKKNAKALFLAQNLSKPYGFRKQKRRHSKVTKHIRDREEEDEPMTKENTPLKQEPSKDGYFREFKSPGSSIDFCNRVPELAEIARRLHMTGEPATNLQISAAGKFLASSKWSVDDLKDSEPFEEIGTKLGLERMRREIIIFQHIGEVSFSLLGQNLINNNELDVFQETVISWMVLRESDTDLLADLPPWISRNANAPSAAEGMRAFLEAYKKNAGFKRWSFSRLKILARYNNDVLHKCGMTQIATLTDSVTKVQDWSASSDIKEDVSSNTPLKPAPTPRLGSDSSSTLSEEDVIPRYEEVSTIVQEYSLDLDMEKSRILNIILGKQNILREAQAEANQARAAFDKESLLPDLQAHIAVMLSTNVEWTVETAADFGDSLFELGRISRDLIRDSLVRPLHVEKQAGDDLEDYLRRSPDAAVLAGANAVLNELVGLQETLQYE